jgi:hypothetical protein
VLKKRVAAVAVGYLFAWLVRKAKRAGGRADAEADRVVHAGMDRLHEHRPWQRQRPAAVSGEGQAVLGDVDIHAEGGSVAALRMGDVIIGAVADPRRLDPGQG